MHKINGLKVANISVPRMDRKNKSIVCFNKFNNTSKNILKEATTSRRIFLKEFSYAVGWLYRK